MPEAPLAHAAGCSILFDDGHSIARYPESVRISALRVVFVPLLLSVLQQPTHAEFRVCNQTLNLYNVAVGFAKGEEFHTEGWWAVTGNSCVSIIKKPLTNRYIYLYVTNTYGSPAIDGDTLMCVDRIKFSILGTEECWQRGYERVGFTEIDTRDFDNWTVFLDGE